MLREATMQDIKLYSNVLWEMALRPDSCCYPIYYDGIKTKEDLMDSLRESIQSDTQTLLIYEENGIFYGMIGYFRIKEDQYIQLNFCIVQQGIRNAMYALMQHLKENVKSGTVYSGFPEENREAIAFMEENCF